LVKLVTKLLRDKPRDPVPYIYTYLSELSSQKVKDPRPLTDNEVNKMRNLGKKADYLREKLDHEGACSDEEEDSPQSEEEQDKVQPGSGGKQPARHSMQRAGISAEVYGAWNQKGVFVPKVVAKSQDVKDRLKKRLLSAFMFDALDEKEFEIVIDSIEEVQVAKGEILIHEGDEGDCMYVVESGILSCTKIFKGATEPTFLKEYKPGEGFGELALLYNAPRAATIAAKTDSVVWRLDRDTFNHIVKDAASKKRATYESFLSTVKILTSMDPYER